MRHLMMAAFGTAFGFGLSRIGFADYGAVHRMHTFAELRMFLAFAGAVVLSAVVFAKLVPRGAFPRRLHRGTIPGSLLFGVGWALTGACPAIALVQLGQGRLASLVTVTGIIVGTWLHRRAQARLRWDGGSCDT